MSVRSDVGEGWSVEMEVKYGRVEGRRDGNSTLAKGDTSYWSSDWWGATGVSTNARERQNPRTTHSRANALATPIAGWVARRIKEWAHGDRDWVAQSELGGKRPSALGFFLCRAILAWRTTHLPVPETATLGGWCWLAVVGGRSNCC